MTFHGIAVRIIEKQGDLFKDSTVSVFAHCVSRDLAMGRGIALEFKRRFGSVFELQCQRKDVGEVAVLNLREDAALIRMRQQEGLGSGFVYIPNFIYYLVTKANYYDKPTMDTLRQSLVAMREHMILHGVTTVGIPRIGCGLDGLKWPRVKELLMEVFSEPDERWCTVDSETGVVMKPSITFRVWTLH